MKRLKKFLAMITAITALLSVTACENQSSSSEIEIIDDYSSNTSTEISTQEIEPEDDGISGSTIVWLADYDLNPANNQERSVALTLFEDVYGGSIEYIYTAPDEKYATLSSKILAGDTVDMFPYDCEVMPNGVLQNQYQPLDDYYDVLDMENQIWDDMQGLVDMFEYDDKHYVIPYAVSDCLLLTYSRTLMENEGFQDPYTLYVKGEWNWDTFMDMMQTFVSREIESTSRYGICGDFSQALFQSTGQTIVKNENGTLVNNINNSSIQKAGAMMQEINTLGLYYDEWVGHFPENNNTLFYSMSEQSLGESNANNPEGDIMVVPFPKESSSDKYYLSANYSAKMLVKGSVMGDAVATYIKCERIANNNEEYKEAKKKNALVVDETAYGIVRSFVTAEQYDAIQEFKNMNNLTPVFDFGYGMGSNMYGNGERTYETRGVMNNLMEALFEENENISSWDELSKSYTTIIDDEISKFNQ